ncbi:hypothetical protein C4573_05340 [Candidatus Woesearchaeota archaeon]|nr:MAG: hypothetical protein C4573_05340 [Candidatus Woesearchaeota archaeon]
MQEIPDLRQIGLSQGEIKVYYALLEIGECTKTLLAKHSGVSPANIYDITNRLAEKGLISRVVKDGIQHFSPANPNSIRSYIAEKEETLAKEKQLAESIIPALLQQYHEHADNVSVQVFNGWKGLKTVFEELLEECTKGDENRVFGASKGESEKTADAFFLKYSKMRERKGIKTKIIFNNEMKSRKERIDYFLKSKAYDCRFIAQSTPVEIMCYKNRVCIIILTKEPLTIRITGKEAADSFKQYFEILWKSAK